MPAPTGRTVRTATRSIWRPSTARPTSGAVTCAGCHTSSAFSSMTKPWDGTCAACHADRHGSMDASHAPLPENVGCFGSFCHASSPGLAGLHSSATTVVAGETRTSCKVCHADGAPTVKDCTVCHAATHDLSMHATLPDDAGCLGVGCHVGDLTGIHSMATTTVAGDVRTACAVCHATGTPTSRDCVTCHPTSPHPDAPHIAGGPCVTSGCHPTNVTRIHQAAGCASCHAVGKTPSIVCASVPRRGPAHREQPRDQRRMRRMSRRHRPRPDPR